MYLCTENLTNTHMAILSYSLTLALFLLAPALVLHLCRRYSILAKIGPIILLYALGIAIGNIPGLPNAMTTLQELLPNIMVPLAIPMMLYGCRFRREELGLQAKVCISGFLSVALAVAGGYLLFGRELGEGTQIGGIISGMYTGGTINAAALQTIFQTESSTFTLINSYDIVISFLYFVFLFSIGIRLFRRLYGEPAQRRVLDTEDCSNIVDTEVDNVEGKGYKGLLTRQGLKELGKTFGLTLIIVAISGATALLMPEGWFMVVFILMITTLGVVASFFGPVRKLERSYDIGMYLIYIFSLAIATMADFSKVDIAAGLNQIGFMLFSVFVSLTLHAIVCRLLRVDADSMVISSVAFINSPPFVPMAAGVMRNRSALVTGLGAGIVGYSLGNHFGVLMESLLQLL